MSDINVVNMVGKVSKYGVTAKDKFVKFTLEVNVPKNGRGTTKSFIPVTGFGKLFMEDTANLQPGDTVAVNGIWSKNTWTGQDGVKHVDDYVNGQSAVCVGAASKDLLDITVAGKISKYGVNVGEKYARFTVENVREYARDNNRNQITTYVGVTAFEPALFDKVSALKEGDYVVVHAGGYTKSTYTGQDGTEKTSSSIVMDGITTFGKAAASSEPQVDSDGFMPAPEPATDDDDSFWD